MTLPSHRMSLAREDCVCPVCMEIFVEPVTLPCTHTFCKDCFLQAVDKASLCCPLCRVRVSSWTRTNTRNHTLVNQTLWTHIQNVFPQQSPRPEETLPIASPRVSQPGEVRREYEDQILKLRGLEEESERASEEFIRKLQQEEEELQKAELQRQQEDERLARLLNNQMNAPPSEENRVHGNTLSSKKKDLGPMDRFLIPCPTHSSLSSNQSPENPSDGGGAKKRRELKEPSNQPPGCVMWAEFEQEGKRRRQQEVEDRAVAERLQQQLNDERRRRRRTDRRKGSPGQYQLRDRPQTSQRQASLTDMF